LIRTQDKESNKTSDGGRRWYWHSLLFIIIILNEGGGLQTVRELNSVLANRIVLGLGRGHLGGGQPELLNKRELPAAIIAWTRKWYRPTALESCHGVSWRVGMTNRYQTRSSRHGNAN
jgi:hypothetical protein